MLFEDVTPPPPSPLPSSPQSLSVYIRTPTHSVHVISRRTYRKEQCPVRQSQPVQIDWGCTFLAKCMGYSPPPFIKMCRSMLSASISADKNEKKVHRVKGQRTSFQVTLILIFD